MWTRGGRSTRGGVQVLMTNYTALLAEHVQSTLCLFSRAVHTADSSQLATLCDIISADIVGKYLEYINWVSIQGIGDGKEIHYFYSSL